MTYSNSPLVSFVQISPWKNKRTKPIDTITPHCFVGQVSVERIGKEFVKLTRDASCNYGIGVDGRVAMCVEESYRSHCSSNKANDERAVTIECASNTTAPYAFNAAVYDKLVELCTDICRRYGKTKLVWIPNKSQAIAYNPQPNEMKLTVHRWFKNKPCPGDWLYSRLGNLAVEVTKRLANKGVDYSLVYDPIFYWNKYKDQFVAAGLTQFNEPILNDHFERCGMDQLWQGCEEFNPTVYKNAPGNADLRAAFGDNNKAYYQHYIQFGYKENRVHK